ncbi:family S53 protease-like protein [Ganoderma leucocontextum]|nr:family S53 protease-like protein [Ganoderma leucocontextum]
MLLALNPTNKTGLIDTLLDISDPTSPNYGQYLSKAQVLISSVQVESFVAPPQESVQAVTNWLAQYNTTPDVISPAGDIMRVHVPVTIANTLLSANYTAFTQNGTGAIVHKTDVYSIPAAMQPHLAAVYPTTQHRWRSKRAVLPARCVDGIDPGCVQALYNFPTAPATAPNNSLAVSWFINEIANQTDLTVRLYRTSLGTFSVQSVDGGITSGKGTLEASLDIQYTVGLATNVPTTFVSVGQENQDGSAFGFLDIINFFLSEDNPPLVLTTSFDFQESRAIQPPLPGRCIRLLCFAYAQLETRGTSILFASGDGGVAGQQASDTCDGGLFAPTFPSTCPFVTSVGSTESVAPEVAETFSASKFSNVFPRPDYQTAPALAYLDALNLTGPAGSPLAGRFNTTGRAFPDVSMTGRDIAIIAAGVPQPVLGTSASTPMFASMVAVVNDLLLNAGLPPLGFLNPLLYSTGAAGVFNDIDVGNNPGCGTDGFPALPGWDPVTGLGTPDFNRLLAVAKASASFRARK